MKYFSFITNLSVIWFNGYVHANVPAGCASARVGGKPAGMGAPCYKHFFIVIQFFISFFILQSYQIGLKNQNIILKSSKNVYQFSG